MSAIYVGNGTNPAAAVAGHTKVPIGSSTNTSPIQLNFASPHGFNQNDTIEVEGHLVNTAANGTWRIQVLTANVIALINSVGNGVGASTGYCIDYQVTPAPTIPTDGDLITAASVNVALEGSADQAPFFYRLAGTYRLMDVFDVDFGTGTPTSWMTAAVSSATFAAQTPTGASAPGLFGFAQGTTPRAPAIRTGDKFEITLNVQGSCLTASQDNQVGIGIALDGGSYTLFPTSTIVFRNPADFAATMHFTSASFSGNHSYWDMAIMVASVGGVAATWQGYGIGHLQVKQWRPN